jgi:hypothetical protein
MEASLETCCWMAEFVKGFHQRRSYAGMFGDPVDELEQEPVFIKRGDVAQINRMLHGFEDGFASPVKGLPEQRHFTVAIPALEHTGLRGEPDGVFQHREPRISRELPEVLVDRLQSATVDIRNLGTAEPFRALNVLDRCDHPACGCDDEAILRGVEALDRKALEDTLGAQPLQRCAGLRDGASVCTGGSLQHPDQRLRLDPLHLVNPDHLRLIRKDAVWLAKHSLDGSD